MPQLYCRDLRGGDILLQVNNGSFINQVIRFGQQVMGRGTEQIIHAGIMYDNRYIIESAGAGIIANDLFVKDRIYGYHVFRCRNKTVADESGKCAKTFFEIHQKSHGLKYDVGGAVASIFTSSGKPQGRDHMENEFHSIMEHKAHRFFCSQFVVFVYQYAAEQNGIAASQIFNFADAKIPPSTLASSMKHHVMFQEIGYMMENER